MIAPILVLVQGIAMEATTDLSPQHRESFVSVGDDSNEFDCREDERCVVL